MTDTEMLSKLRGIRKSYLRNISNVEIEISELISNIDVNDDNQKTKLIAKKNSLLEKIE